STTSTSLPVQPKVAVAMVDVSVSDRSPNVYVNPSDGRVVSPPVSALTADGSGAWTITSAGAVITIGSARAYGDMTEKSLNAPINGLFITQTGNGYYLVGGDGGVFAFGDASFHGSMASHRLNQPMIGGVVCGNGYWLVS